MSSDLNEEFKRLIEGFVLSDEAQQQITLVAARTGRPASEIEQDLISRFERRFGSASSRKRDIRITKSAVVRYDIGNEIFSPALYFWDPNEGFRRADTLDNVLGDDKEVEGDEDADAEDLDREEEEADEEESAAEETEDEEQPQEQPQVSDVPVDSTAMRQRGESIVTKEIEVTTPLGQKSLQRVPMKPIARFYQMMPKTSLVRHVQEIVDKYVISLIADELKDDPKIEPKNFAENLVSKSRIVPYLRFYTPLTEPEITSIMGSIEISLVNYMPPVRRAIVSSAPNSDNLLENMIKKVRESVFLSVGNRALAGRSDNGNLVQYLAGDVATRSQKTRIEAGERGLTAGDVTRAAQKLESLMNFQNREFDADLASLLGGQSESSFVAGETGFIHSSNADIESTKGGVVTSSKGTWREHATAAQQEEASLVALVGDRGSRKLPNLSPVGSPRTIGGVANERVTSEIRSGENDVTLYNTIADRRDLAVQIRGQKIRVKGEGRAVDAVPTYPTSVKMLLEEIRSVASHTGAISDDQSSPDLAESRAEGVRDGYAKLGGLIEYLSMTGPALLPPGSGVLKQRVKMIALSSAIEGAALDLTDKIVRASVTLTYTDTQIAAARELTNLRAKLASAEEIGDDDEIVALRSQIKSKEEEIEASSTLRIRQSLQDDVTEILVKHDLETIVRDATSFAQEMQRGLGEMQVEIDPPGALRSRRDIMLAEMRPRRMRLIGANIKAAATRRASSDNRDRSVDDLATARDIREARASAMMRHLASSNKSTMHLLRPDDTIDSVCQEYAIGRRVVASDIEFGFLCLAALPADMGVGSDPVGCRVTTVASGRDPDVTILIGDNSSGVKIKRSKFLAAITRAAPPASVEEARVEFTRNFASATSELYRSLTEAENPGPFEPDPTTPLLPQLIERLYKDEVDQIDVDLQRATRQLASVMRIKVSDNAVLQSFDVDSRNDRNSRLENTLLLLGILASLSSRDDIISSIGPAFPQFKDYGGIASRVSLLRRMNFEVEDPKMKSLVDDSKTIMASARNQVQSVLEAAAGCLEIIVTTREDLARIKSEWQTGSLKERYTSLLQELPVPVPARKSLLTPGAQITVAAPRRTLGESGLDFAEAMGVRPQAMITPPVKGFMAGIRAATRDTILPVLSYALAADLARSLASRILRAASEEGGEITVSNEAAADMLKFLIDRIVRRAAMSGNVAVDPNELQEGIERAVNEIVGGERSLVYTNAQKIDVARIMSKIADYLQEAVKDATDLAASALTTRQGVTALAKVAPCTAQMISLTAGAESALLLRILIATPDQFLKNMSADHARSIFGSAMGERSSDSYASSIVSPVTDRLARAINFVSTQQSALAAEADAYASNTPRDVEIWEGNPPAAAVIMRAIRIIRRRDRLEKRAKVPSALIADYLGAKSESDDDIELAAEAVYNKITAEMSVLTDGNEGSQIYKIVHDLVRRRIRASTDPASAIEVIADSTARGKKVFELMDKNAREIRQEITENLPTPRFENLARVISTAAVPRTRDAIIKSLAATIAARYQSSMREFIRYV